MYAAFLSLYEVRTMADVRARAEFLAWSTRDAYRDSAHHFRGLSDVERAEAALTALIYKRRAIRASQYANAKQHHRG